MEEIHHALKRILVVDDEEAITFSYKKLLRGASVEVDACGSLEEAIEMIRGNDYDVILTDFRLSHSESCEGLDILRYVKEHSPETPVFFMTGYGSDEIKDHALAFGATHYIDKPVQIFMLVKLLRELGVLPLEY